MKDKNGNKVKPGDILMVQNGGMTYQDKFSPWFELWEMPSRYEEQGIRYGLDGKPYEYAYAFLEESVKIVNSELPDRFLYSFYHGMDGFMSTTTEGSVIEIINKSDWKERIITESDVKNYLAPIGENG